MAKGDATPKAKQAVAVPANPESLQERKALAGQLLAKLLRLRNEPVEVDDTPQPKYVEAGPVSKERLKENAKVSNRSCPSSCPCPSLCPCPWPCPCLCHLPLHFLPYCRSP